jgi:predicted small secreted protein
VSGGQGLIQAARRFDPRDWSEPMLGKASLGFLVSGLLVLAVLGVSGCSTVEGFGKDVQKGGEAIERAADRSKSN